MYNRGQGVPQDYSEAVKWYRLAAEQGDVKAQNNLGVMYANGKGVPQDIVQAYKWFSIGASKSAASDQPKDRIEAAKNRDLAASQMTPEQIADGQKLAGEWKPK
jgi:TPR repeat protein